MVERGRETGRDPGEEVDGLTNNETVLVCIQINILWVLQNLLCVSSYLNGSGGCKAHGRDCTVETPGERRERWRLEEALKEVKKMYPDAHQKVLEKAIRDKMTAQALKSVGIDPNNYGIKDDTDLYGHRK